MKAIKQLIAKAAAAVGLLPLLTDAYLFFRFRRRSGSQEAEQRRSLSGEHQKMPPAWLRFSSSGTDGVEWFLTTGEKGAELVRRLAADAVVGTDQKPAILDYGCGCGRVLRHLTDQDAEPIWGVDWNRRTIRWCSKNLPHARFVVGGLKPPLAVPETETFHLIYAFSVFTHLPVDLQRAWLRELADRLRPGGILAISTHGDDFRQGLSEEELEFYEAGEIVVRQAGVAGTNVCAAYHPSGSLPAVLPSTLEVEAHEPAGAVGNPPQDLWILRRTHDSIS